VLILKKLGCGRVGCFVLRRRAPPGERFARPMKWLGNHAGLANRYSTLILIEVRGKGRKGLCDSTGKGTERSPLPTAGLLTRDDLRVARDWGVGICSLPRLLTGNTQGVVCRSPLIQSPTMVLAPIRRFDGEGIWQ
jgi:hypothetical protein